MAQQTNQKWQDVIRYAKNFIIVPILILLIYLFILQYPPFYFATRIDHVLNLIFLDGIILPIVVSVAWNIYVSKLYTHTPFKNFLLGAAIGVGCGAIFGSIIGYLFADMESIIWGMIVGSCGGILFGLMNTVYLYLRKPPETAPVAANDTDSSTNESQQPKQYLPIFLKYIIWGSTVFYLLCAFLTTLPAVYNGSSRDSVVVLPDAIFISTIASIVLSALAKGLYGHRPFVNLLIGFSIGVACGGCFGIHVSFYKMYSGDISSARIMGLVGGILFGFINAVYLYLRKPPGTSRQISGRPMRIRFTITVGVIGMVMIGSWLGWRTLIAGNMIRSAFYKEDYQQICLLIRLGAPVDYKLSFGLSGGWYEPLLCYAINAELRDFSEFLIKQGANPNAQSTLFYQDRPMENPPLLILAHGNQDPYIAELLLRHGADPNFKDGAGFTPEHYWPELSEIIKKVRPLKSPRPESAH